MQACDRIGVGEGDIGTGNILLIIYIVSRTIVLSISSNIYSATRPQFHLLGAVMILMLWSIDNSFGEKLNFIEENIY